MKKIFLVILVFIVLASSDSASIAQVRQVNAIAITVSDMDRAIQFYSDVLQFKKVTDVELFGSYWENLFGVFGIRFRTVRMELGEESILLVDYLTTGGRSIPEDARSNDLAFQHIAIVVSDMDSAYNILRKFNVAHVSTGPQTLPIYIPAAAGIRAFYFQDPDRHILEIIYFPPGKGLDKWQKNNGEIFLGIDHTAIGISHTGNSHKFYEDMLGVNRIGDSWNRGIEQEHLNNVEGASLQITGYRSTSGPGIEFLEYIQPGPGKKYPVDTRSDDIWNWLTVLQVGDAVNLYSRLKAALPSNRFVSRNFLSNLKNEKSFIIRDLDGHALLITEKQVDQIFHGLSGSSEK